MKRGLSKRVSSMPVYLLLFAGFVILFSILISLFVSYFNSERQGKTERLIAAEKAVNSRLVQVWNALDSLVINARVRTFFAEDYLSNKEGLLRYLSDSPEIQNILNAFSVSNSAISDITVYSLVELHERENYWYSYEKFTEFSFAKEFESEPYNGPHFYENGNLYFVRRLLGPDFAPIGAVTVRCEANRFFADSFLSPLENEIFSISEGGETVLERGTGAESASVSATADEQIGIRISYGYSVAVLTVFLCSIVALLSVFTFGTLKVRKYGKTYAGKIDAIMAGIDEISRGNNRVEIDMAGEDEFSVLAGCINRMVKDIESNVAAVYEKKIQLQNAEMELFQNQINPHFLYNILSMMNWKAIECGNDGLSAAIMSLSNYYRSTLANGRNIVRVSEELCNVESYLFLQKQLKGGKVDYSIAVDESVKDTKVPKLILQPLVENSVEHGILEGRPIAIRIRGTVSEELCVLEVSDNGRGMDSETLAALRENRSSGYAYRNIRLRLANCFAERYALTVESSPGEGTTVKITYPYE